MKEHPNLFTATNHDLLNFDPDELMSKLNVDARVLTSKSLFNELHQATSTQQRVYSPLAMHRKSPGMNV